ARKGDPRAIRRPLRRPPHVEVAGSVIRELLVARAVHGHAVQSPQKPWSPVRDKEKPSAVGRPIESEILSRHDANELNVRAVTVHQVRLESTCSWVEAVE